MSPGSWKVLSKKYAISWSVIISSMPNKSGVLTMRASFLFQGLVSVLYCLCVHIVGLIMCANFLLGNVLVLLCTNRARMEPKREGRKASLSAWEGVTKLVIATHNRMLERLQVGIIPIASSSTVSKEVEL
jgi:hypothetical protein